MQELSAQQYVQDHRPRSWSRSTVADGRWMQDKTFTPLNGNDEQLGIFIDDLVKGLNTEETTRANADEAEAAARQQNDSDLSAWCTRLTNSAEDLYSGLADEVAARQAAIEAEQRARTQGDVDTLASAKEYANDASALALAEAKTYANDTSSYLNGRINGVSSTFNSFSSDLKTWKEDVENWEGEIDTWKSGIDDWREDTVDPKLNALESAIAGIEGASDVYDVVGTSAALNNYVGRLTPKAVIKVLSGGPNNDQQVYYRWNHNNTASGTWTIADFDYIGGVQAYYDKGYIDSNYYKKTETYTQTEVDDYLKWKVDTSKSQNFTAPQQWQARQNIGASDGKIQWTQLATGQTMKTTSADLSITYRNTGDNYYRLRANDGTTSQDWALVPEPANGQNNYLLTVTSNGIEWKAPSAELPTVTRPDDVGKALVVGSEGLSWDDRGKGILTVDASNLTTNTYDEISAAVAAGKDVILDRDTGMGTHSVSHIYADWYKTAQFTRIYGDKMFNSSISQGSDTLYERSYRLLWTSAQDLSAAEQNQVRTNIGASRAPLIIPLYGSSRTLSDDEMNALAKATDNRTPEYTPLIYIMHGESTNTRYFHFTTLNGGISYIFTSTDTNDMSYIEVMISTKEAVLHKTLEIVNEMPSTFEAGTIYVV